MKDFFGKHALEPVWQAEARLRQGQLPPKLDMWLLDGSSLTRRLQQHCTGRFSVQVLRLGWMRPMLNEARTLGVPYQQTALIREVHLLCDGQPWVFARTVIPLSSLRGKLRRLLGLGNRPLGAVLFADPHMRRSPIEVAQIHHGESLYLDATKRHPSQHAIWGRRSVFHLGGAPLLVSEIFLPDHPAASGGGSR